MLAKVNKAIPVLGFQDQPRILTKANKKNKCPIKKAPNQKQNRIQKAKKHPQKDKTTNLWKLNSKSVLGYCFYELMDTRELRL